MVCLKLKPNFPFGVSLREMIYNLEVLGLKIVYIKNPHISARVSHYWENFKS